MESVHNLSQIGQIILFACFAALPAFGDTQPCARNCFDDAAATAARGGESARRLYLDLAEQRHEAELTRADALSSVGEYLRANGVTFREPPKELGRPAASQTLAGPAFGDVSGPSIARQELSACWSMGGTNCYERPIETAEASPRRPPERVAGPAISAPTPQLARAAVAYQTVSSGRGLEGANLTGVDPAVVHRLRIAANAAGRSKELTRRMSESASTYRELEGLRAAGESSGERLGSVKDADTFARRKPAALAAAKGPGSVAGEPGTSAILAAEARKETTANSEQGGAAISVAEKGQSQETRSAVRQQPAAGGQSVITARPEVPLRALKSRKDALRDELRRKLAGSPAGEAEEAPRDALVRDLVRAADEQSSIAADRERLIAAGFTLSGAETDAEVRRLLAGSEARLAGILGAESETLFRRVHVAHERVSELFGVHPVR